MDANFHMFPFVLIFFNIIRLVSFYHAIMLFLWLVLQGIPVKWCFTGIKFQTMK